MHKLRSLAAQVERTHKRLGNLVAFSVLCVHAKKCLLVVSPAGTGKSTASETIKRLVGDSMTFDSVTRNGLQVLAKSLQDYSGLVVIDDMGKIDSWHSRVNTLSTFAELCYSHYVEKHAQSIHVSISNYHGSAILNIQPPILSELIRQNDWEAVAMDKTIRYYHLYRPVEPHEEPPEVEVDLSVDPKTVELTGKGGVQWQHLSRMLAYQWSDARLHLHLGDLLRSAAALDGRQRVNSSDYKLLESLAKPLALERHLVDKVGLEEGRTLNNNLLALLVELASWPQLSVERVCRDYKVGPHTVNWVVGNLRDYFRLDLKSPGTISVLPRAVDILREAGARR